MAKTVTATEAKVHLGAIMDWAVVNADDVIIEARGRPKAVLIGFEEYQALLRLREEAARSEALRRMEALAKHIGDRNADLTEEDGARLANRFTRAVVAEMLAEGRVKYQGR